MTFKHNIQLFFRRRGFNIDRYLPSTHTLARRMKLFKTYQVNAVLDVGGNIGSYGVELREQGYKGDIISFEPMRASYELLSVQAKKDPHWKIFNFALGAVEHQTEINVSDNSYSSSLLEMLPAHLDAAPASRYIGRETVKVKTMDAVFDTLPLTRKNIYLKIDVQGFEKSVLEGAKESLMHINTIQIEMSLVPLYKEGGLFVDMVNLLVDKGYSLVSLEPGFGDPNTGELLQVDGIFHKQS